MIDSGSLYKRLSVVRRVRLAADDHVIYSYTRATGKIYTHTREHSIGFFSTDFVSPISFAISPRAPASDRWLRSRPRSPLRTRAAAAASANQSVVLAAGAGR